MLFLLVVKQKQFETNEDCRKRSGEDSITRIKISRNCNLGVFCILHGKLKLAQARKDNCA
jgi:hypothetical protein